MKLKTISIAALAVCFALFCSACSPASLEPSADMVSPSNEQDITDPVDQGDEASSYFADFSDLAITFNGEYLDSAVLEFYYNAIATDFINTYYSELEDIGLYIDLPFNMQTCAYDSEISWADYFFNSAASRMHSEYAISRECQEIGLALTESDESEIQGILASYDETYSGDRAAIEEMLKERFGANMTYEIFERQIYMSYMANRWQYYREDSFDFSDEELRVYLSDEEFESLDYNMVNVRHILVSENETALELLDEWNSDPTEEKFAELAATHTTDTYSAADGGMYLNILRDEMTT